MTRDSVILAAGGPASSSQAPFTGGGSNGHPFSIPTFTATWFSFSTMTIALLSTTRVIRCM